MNCLFCDIIHGKVPSSKIYENDKVLAFNDIDPKAPFHAIIIPKIHIASAADISVENSDYISAVFEAIAIIAREYDLEKGFRVVNNCGTVGGQTVGHIHFHMLARRNLAWPPG